MLRIKMPLMRGRELKHRRFFKGFFCFLMPLMRGRELKPLSLHLLLLPLMDAPYAGARIETRGGGAGE